jgi:hypothetical protein
MKLYNDKRIINYSRKFIKRQSNIRPKHKDCNKTKKVIDKVSSKYLIFQNIYFNFTFLRGKIKTCNALVNVWINTYFRSLLIKKSIENYKIFVFVTT